MDGINVLFAFNSIQRDARMSDHRFARDLVAVSANVPRPLVAEAKTGAAGWLNGFLAPIAALNTSFFADPDGVI